MWANSDTFEQKKLRALSLLSTMSRFWDVFLWANITLMQGTLVLSIYWKMRSPMKPKVLNVKLRTLVYNIIVFIACMDLTFNPGMWDLKKLDGDESKALSCMLFVTGYLVVYYLGVVFTTVAICFMMDMLGLGKEIKKKIIIRFVLQVVMFMICNVYLVYAISTHFHCAK